MQAESNCRELLNKTIGQYEITFDDIFKNQSSIWFKWQSDKTYWVGNTSWIWEYYTCKEYGWKAEQLVHENETVVLISDMYLPKEIITNMISLISPRLAALPLYLSSDKGVQKVSQQLYLKSIKIILHGNLKVDSLWW